MGIGHTLKTAKQGTKFYHNVHGDVKLVWFNYGTCLVKARKLIIRFEEGKPWKQRYEWLTITVLTKNLKEIN